jgi:hypothetical protein
VLQNRSQSCLGILHQFDGGVDDLGQVVRRCRWSR